MTIEGRCDPAFRAVREEFARGFGELARDPERRETGAAVAVTVGGRTVVDLWGGVADPEAGRHWGRHTLANVFSTSKGITALLAHRLVEQGRLDLEAPVARYWPEFAAKEKAGIRVHQLLSHRAGLAALREPLAAEDIYCWDRMSAALAAERPWWTPGERHGYHAFTFGWLVGELIRRVSGSSPGRFLREEVAGPLGLDLHIGIEAIHHERVARLTPLPPARPGSDPMQLVSRILAAPGSVSARAFTNPPNLLAPGEVNSTRWREAEIPAANAHATARALAALYAAAASGTLLSRESLARCSGETSAGPDEVLRIPTRFSLGFMLGRPGASFGPGARTFGHPGAGGSLGLADPDAGLGFGYVPNRMGAHVLVDPRAEALLQAVYGCL